MRLLCWRTKRSGRQWYPCLQQRRYQRETSNHSTSKSFDEHCLRSRMFVKHLQATWFLDYGTPSLHFLFAVNFIPLSLLWWIVFRASLPPETTAFLNSIATTVENVSYHLFFSPHLFIYKQVRESNKILRLTGVHLEHRGEDKEELNELVERAMQAMQTHAGVLTTTGIYLIPLSFTLSFTSFTLFLSFSLSLFLSFPLTHLFFPFEFSLVLQGLIVARTCKNCKLILLKMEILFFLFFFSHFIWSSKSEGEGKGWKGREGDGRDGEVKDG